MNWLAELACHGDAEWRFALETLSRMRDRRADPGRKRPVSLLALLDARIAQVLDGVAPLEAGNACNLATVRRMDWQTRQNLRLPGGPESTLVLDMLEFPPEGDECASRWLAKAYQLGWRHLIAYRWRGGRFAGSGGGNLFSLASGGAIYLRDPGCKMGEAQLNGGRFAPLTEADWALIRPYLLENQRLFDISLSALLTADGTERSPAEVYRKVVVRPLTELT